jgi:hypothetical protein
VAFLVCDSIASANTGIPLLACDTGFLKVASVGRGQRIGGVAAASTGCYPGRLLSGHCYAQGSNYRKICSKSGCSWGVDRLKGAGRGGYGQQLLPLLLGYESAPQM